MGLLKRTFVILLAVSFLSGCGIQKLWNKGSSSAVESSESAATSSSEAEQPAPPKPEETPEGVAQLAFDAFKALDQEKMTRYIDGMDSVSALTQGDALQTAQLITKNLSCKIGAAQIDGDAATVDVEITNTDFSGVISGLLPSALLWLAQNPNPTQEELSAYFSDKLSQALAGAGGEPVTKPVQVSLVRNGESWKVKLDVATADALFGGMLGSLGGLAEQFGIQFPQ